jgi:quinol monooxygenase YgiN
MEFMNIVRMEIKPGQFEAWQAIMAGNAERAKAMGGVPGMIETRQVQFGENKICIVGRWASKDAFMAMRPMLVQNLNAFRHLLVGEDTDAIAGSVVFSTAQ